MAGFKLCLEELIKRQEQQKQYEKLESKIFTGLGVPAHIVGPPPVSVEGAILKRKLQEGK